MRLMLIDGRSSPGHVKLDRRQISTLYLVKTAVCAGPLKVFGILSTVLDLNLTEFVEVRSFI